MKSKLKVILVKLGYSVLTLLLIVFVEEFGKSMVEWSELHSGITTLILAMVLTSIWLWQPAKEEE